MEIGSGTAYKVAAETQHCTSYRPTGRAFGVRATTETVLRMFLQLLVSYRDGAAVVAMLSEVAGGSAYSRCPIQRAPCFRLPAGLRHGVRARSCSLKAGSV